ncbi:peptidase inhibitor family I36 protein [Tengunoibacter tsumagoiensis]|uniref:Peptidase inhibitor family I36 n=1 Tax=Tengunoibacter tsumagoiensis TaxID=2014871 RepID=A0A402A7D4_9CHLR|nr:peptidase inhibitor family I36 protein [Tengunoibacter tsumagoiensis]GCE15052.1 hypothetical protein KTT_49110 [Tengunoibacter tsumagoiensis]
MKVIQRLCSFGASMLLVLVFSVGVFGTNQAHAATIPVSQTAHSGIQQQVATLLQQVPGSKQTAWNAVSLDNGKTIVTFTTKAYSVASGPSNCRSGWFCLWYDTGYTGAEVQSSSYRCDSSSALVLLNYFPTDGLGSYINYSPYTLKIYNVYDSTIDYESPGHWSSNTSSNNDVYNAASVVESC